MADTIVSANMSLPIPVPGVDAGPDWANNLNACLSIIDGHNHAGSGQGVQITPAGINVSTDLPFNLNNATLLRSANLASNSATFSTSADNGALYQVGRNLYFRDNNGANVQITNAGSISGTTGSIANLVSPASASYVSGSKTIIFQSDVNTPANVDCGFIILRNNSASSKGLTVYPPLAMGGDINITFPTIPAATNLMTMDNAGGMAAATNVDNSTLQLSSNVLAVKDAGITPQKMAALGQQVSSDSGAQTNSSTSFADVTNLTVTITTTGRPVFVCLINQASGTNYATLGAQTTTNTLEAIALFRILSNGTTLSQFKVDSNQSANGERVLVPSPLTYIDVVGAGTYIYKLQFAAGNANSVAHVQYYRLIAYEIF